MYKSKLGKWISNFALGGIFLIAIVCVLMAFKTIPRSRSLIDLLIIVGVLCVGAISSRVLLKLLDRRKNKTFLYVGLGIAAVSCLLWIIFVFIGQNLIDGIVKDEATASDVVGILNYLKFSVAVTIFSFLYTFVISMIYLLKKDKFVLQVIATASALVTDFWLTALIFSCKISEEKFVFDGKWLVEKGMLTVAVIAMVLLFISSIALRRIFKHSSEDMYLEAANDVKEPQNVVESNDASIEARIKKLDALKAQGLISEEDYLAKKKKIIDEI